MHGRRVQSGDGPPVPRDSVRRRQTVHDRVLRGGGVSACQRYGPLFAGGSARDRPGYSRQRRRAALVRPDFAADCTTCLDGPSSAYRRQRRLRAEAAAPGLVVHRLGRPILRRHLQLWRQRLPPPGCAASGERSSLAVFRSLEPLPRPRTVTGRRSGKRATARGAPSTRRWSRFAWPNSAASREQTTLAPAIENALSA